jgi:cell division protein FtsX
MGRKAAVLVVVSALGLLAACGSSAQPALTTRSASSCTLTVFFTARATSAQIDAVKLRLDRDPQVTGSLSISRAQALAQLKKKFPSLTRHLPGNPLGASIQVRLEKGASARRFESHYSAMTLRGVASVKSVTPGGLTCA